MLKSPKQALTRIFSSPRGAVSSVSRGAIDKKQMGISTRGLESDKRAVEFRKAHLESEMAEKERGLTKETKEMFKSAYNKLTSGGDLSKANLRSLFGNLEDQAFEDVYCLFDWDNDGSVDVHEFVLTMSLLATPATSFEAEQDLLFAIFDVDGSGTMDREEFGKMMRATLRCKMTHLDFCMKTEDRKATFRRHLEGEFSTETLEFYSSVDQYRELVQSLDEEEYEQMKDECNELAISIFERFIKAGSNEEVNIQGRIRTEVTTTVLEAKEKGELIPFTIFDLAQQEVRLDEDV